MPPTRNLSRPHWLTRHLSCPHWLPRHLPPPHWLTPPAVTHYGAAMSELTMVSVSVMWSVVPTRATSITSSGAFRT